MASACLASNTLDNLVDENISAIADDDFSVADNEDSDAFFASILQNLHHDTGKTLLEVTPAGGSAKGPAPTSVSAQEAVSKSTDALNCLDPYEAFLQDLNDTSAELPLPCAPKQPQQDLHDMDENITAFASTDASTVESIFSRDSRASDTKASKAVKTVKAVKTLQLNASGVSKTKKPRAKKLRVRIAPDFRDAADSSSTNREDTDVISGSASASESGSISTDFSQVLPHPQGIAEDEQNQDGQHHDSVSEHGHGHEHGHDDQDGQDTAGRKKRRTLREPAVFKRYFPPRWDSEEEFVPTMRVNMSSAELNDLMGKYGSPSPRVLDDAGRRVAEKFDSWEWEPCSSLLIKAAKRHPSYNTVIRNEPVGGPRRSLLFVWRRGDMIADFEEQVYAHYEAKAAEQVAAAAGVPQSELIEPTLAAEEHLSKLREHSLKRRELRKSVRALPNDAGTVSSTAMDAYTPGTFGDDAFRDGAMANNAFSEYAEELECIV